MSRSVSYARGAAWVLYTHVDTLDEDFFAWEDFIENLIHEFKQAFPSLYEASGWIGNEDRVLLQNRHAKIGVSEYFGLVSVWCVPKEHPEWGGWNPLADNWCEQIRDKAATTLESFAPRLVKEGCMSNGECVFREVTHG